MPRKPIAAKRPIAAMRPFGRPMPASAMARMQSRPGQMARLSRAQARNPMAGRAEVLPMAMDARRQMPFFQEAPSIRERPEPRAAGMKTNWQQSFWFQIPFLGPFVDLLRSLVYPQEQFRVTKRAFVGTGIGSIAKNRLAARLEMQRQQKLASRQQALEQRNPAVAQGNTVTRGQAHNASNAQSKKAA